MDTTPCRGGGNLALQMSLPGLESWPLCRPASGSHTSAAAKSTWEVRQSKGFLSPLRVGPLRAGRPPEKGCVPSQRRRTGVSRQSVFLYPRTRPRVGSDLGGKVAGMGARHVGLLGIYVTLSPDLTMMKTAEYVIWTLLGILKPLQPQCCS